MSRELFGSGPAVGGGSENGKAMGGTREAALGVCALARGKEKVDGAEAAQEGVDSRVESPGESLARSHGLLPGEAGGVSPGRGLKVSPSTIHRFLKRSGLVRPSTKRRRPLFQNGRVMRPRNCPGLGYLQMDVKYVTPELSGLPYTCYLYAAMDIYSRYKVGMILPKLDEGGSLLALYHATEQFPFALRYVQTDNGLEFQRRFHAKCTELGLDHFYIHKSSPNENAVIERSFRTDEEECFFLLDQPAQDHLQLNTWYQSYLHIYNTIRPHMGINMLYP